MGPPEKSSDLAPLASLGAASLRIVIQSSEVASWRFVRMESRDMSDIFIYIYIYSCINSNIMLS